MRFCLPKSQLPVKCHSLNLCDIFEWQFFRVLWRPQVSNLSYKQIIETQKFLSRERNLGRKRIEVQNWAAQKVLDLITHSPWKREEWVRLLRLKNVNRCTPNSEKKKKLPKPKVHLKPTSVVAATAFCFFKFPKFYFPNLHQKKSLTSSWLKMCDFFAP